MDYPILLYLRGYRDDGFATVFTFNLAKAEAEAKEEPELLKLKEEEKECDRLGQLIRQNPSYFMNLPSSPRIKTDAFSTKPREETCMTFHH